MPKKDRPNFHGEGPDPFPKIGDTVELRQFKAKEVDITYSKFLTKHTAKFVRCEAYLAYEKDGKPWLNRIWVWIEASEVTKYLEEWRAQDPREPFDPDKTQDDVDFDETKSIKIPITKGWYSVFRTRLAADEAGAPMTGVISPATDDSIFQGRFWISDYQNFEKWESDEIMGIKLEKRRL